MNSAKSGRGVILLLAAVAVLGSLATQLLVPALPVLARELHSNAGDAQLVIGVFLLGLGAGQLVVGPCADRFGRKRVLLAGMLLYSAASACAALAPSFPMLVGTRLFQALGASAGIVTARVLVGDLFPPEQVVARQATLMSVILVSPALAPVIGGALTEWIGWRMIFALLAMAGLAAIVLSLIALPQSHNPEIRGTASPLASSYTRLLKNRTFIGSAGAIAGGSATLYMYLGSAPFMLTNSYGLSPRSVGLCMMLIAGCSIAGTLFVARIERHGDAMLTGSLINLAAAGLFLLLSPFTALAAFIGPAMLLGLGAGVSGPAGIARVVRAEPGIAGTATSLAGAFQMLCSALAAYLLGRFAPVGTATLGIAALLTTGLATFAAYSARAGIALPEGAAPSLEAHYPTGSGT